MAWYFLNNGYIGFTLATNIIIYVIITMIDFSKNWEEDIDGWRVFGLALFIITSLSDLKDKVLSILNKQKL